MRQYLRASVLAGIDGLQAGDVILQVNTAPAVPGATSISRFALDRGCPETHLGNSRHSADLENTSVSRPWFSFPSLLGANFAADLGAVARRIA